MPTLTSNSIRPQDFRRRKTNWTPVRLLNIYRLVLAAIFFGQSFISPSPLVNIVDLTLYSWTSLAFLILAVIWIVASAIERRGFQNQVSLQIYSDTILIILLMHVRRGYRPVYPAISGNSIRLAGGTGPARRTHLFGG
jgi:hypothetical protein